MFQFKSMKWYKCTYIFHLNLSSIYFYLYSGPKHSHISPHDLISSILLSNIPRLLTASWVPHRSYFGFIYVNMFDSTIDSWLPLFAIAHQDANFTIYAFDCQQRLNCLPPFRFKHMLVNNHDCMIGNLHMYMSEGVCVRWRYRRLRWRIIQFLPLRSLGVRWAALHSCIWWICVAIQIVAACCPGNSLRYHFWIWLGDLKVTTSRQLLNPKEFTKLL